MSRRMTIRQLILADCGNEIVADWWEEVVQYFIEHLQRYHAEELETMENMSSGFTDALNDVTEHGSGHYTRDMDEAFKIFLTVILYIPNFAPFPTQMLIIILARFFLENFFYLPPPPTIILAAPSETSSETQSMPSLEGSRPPSVDSGFSASSDLRLNNDGAQPERVEELPYRNT